jgi:organic hydroperoxide reductase OsmC/OhrA
MTDNEIPSGKTLHDSQADGSARAAVPETPSSPPEMHFEASAAWKGDAMGSGALRLGGGGIEIPIAGASTLGGAGGAGNPEELLLGALAACFVNTWAIFIKKLQVAGVEPAVRVTGTLAPDPAGGFHLTGAVVRARVPQTLLTSERPKVEKTLQLAEKYCIISKVARAAMPVKVEIEAV